MPKAKVTGIEENEDLKEKSKALLAFSDSWERERESHQGMFFQRVVMMSLSLELKNLFVFCFLGFYFGFSTIRAGPL